MKNKTIKELIDQCELTIKIVTDSKPKRYPVEWESLKKLTKVVKKAKKEFLAGTNDRRVRCHLISLRLKE